MDGMVMHAIQGMIPGPAQRSTLNFNHVTTSSQVENKRAQEGTKSDRGAYFYYWPFVDLNECDVTHAERLRAVRETTWRPKGLR